MKKAPRPGWRLIVWRVAQRFKNQRRKRLWLAGALIVLGPSGYLTLRPRIPSVVASQARPELPPAVVEPSAECLLAKGKYDLALHYLDTVTVVRRDAISTPGIGSDLIALTRYLDAHCPSTALEPPNQ